MEYSGLQSGWSVDKANSATGNGTAAATGTTGTTFQGNELWIGGIGLTSSGYTLATPTNGFTAVANAASSGATATNNARIYALERIVSATGAASSGGTVSVSSQWSGAIVTFRASDLSCTTCHGGTGAFVDGTARNAGGLGTFAGSHSGHVVTGGYACSQCHVAPAATAYMHENGTITMANPISGGAYVKGTSWPATNNLAPFTACTNTTCHGAASRAWSDNTTAYTCTKCHGTLTTAAMVTNAQMAPNVGAHLVHVRGAGANNYSRELSCTECHNSSTTTANFTGHMNGNKVDVTFINASTALDNGVSSATAWSAGTYPNGSCSVYCHGAAMLKGDTGGTARTPVWTNTSLMTGTASNDCRLCHGNPPTTGTTASTHSGKTATSSCNGCHKHFTTTGGFLTEADRILHINGKIEAAGGSCKGCHGTGSAKDVQVEFAKNSHHTNKVWASITDADCVVCHAEGAISAGAVNTVANRHGNETGTKGVVDLYNADVRTTIYSVTLTDLTGHVAAAHTSLDTFCMSCHDSNGAAAVTSGNGFTGGNVALNPFNDTALSNGYDQQTRGFGAAPAALNVFDAFNPANNSHHAVRAQRYTKTTGLTFGSSLTQAGLLSTTVVNNSGGTGMADNSTLHCSDCHSTAFSAHGGANEYMLQTATSENPTVEHTGPTDYVCIKCHVNGAYNGDTGNHVGNGSDYSHTSELTGTNRVGTTNTRGHISGIACLNCHDGAVGFGGIHGVPNATYTAGANGSGAGTYNKRRFMPGSGLRYYDPSNTHTSTTIDDDGTWGEATATNQCYTLSAASSTSSCTKHNGGTGMSKRNVRRPVTY